MAEPIEVDGRTVSTEQHGEGPPLVVLHGITESMRSWDPVLPHLTPHRRVVLVDLPGHGGSDDAERWGLDDLADDVAAVLDRLDLSAPAVVGHSLGGFVATVLAARHDTGPVVNIDQPLALAAFKDALAPAEPMLRGDAFPVVVGQMFEGFTAELDDGETARLTELRSPNRTAVLGVWDPVFARDVGELDELVRGMLAGIDVPYLAIHGEDPGEEYRAWLADVVPGARLEVRTGGSHYPHLADPAGVAERILGFTS